MTRKRENCESWDKGKNRLEYKEKEKNGKIKV